MKRKGPLRWRRWLLVAGLTVVVLGLLLVIFTWPDVATLKVENPKTTAFITAATERGIEVEWRWASYDQISDHLKKAVLVAEDYSFFSHTGFDTHEIKAAAREAVKGKRVRGASTISQQLAKNLWLSPSLSPTRKLREIVLTRQLERNLSKHRILGLYLNVVEFGPGVFGAEAAARRYFGVSAADLDVVQAAQLAASLPRPSSWHPGVSSRGYEKRVDRILILLEGADWLDKHL